MNEDIGAEEVMAMPTISGQRGVGSKKQPRKKFWMFRLGLFLYDFLCIYGSFWLAGWITDVPFAIRIGLFSGFWPALFAALMLSSFPSHNLYSYHLIFSRKKQFVALHLAMVWGGLSVLFVAGQYALPRLWESNPMAAVLVICGCVAAATWVVKRFPQSIYSILRALGISLIAVWILQQPLGGKLVLLPKDLWIFPFGLVLSSLFLTIGRHFIIEYVYNGWLLLSFRRQVGIIGTNEEAEQIVSHIIENNAPFWVSGTIGIHDCGSSAISKKCLGDIIEIPAICRENRLSEIIITDETIDKRTLISLLDFAIKNSITVWFPPNVLPIIDRKIYIDDFCGMPMIRMGQQRRIVFYDRIKYAIDALLTLPMLAVFLPLFGLIAAAIKINSPGPVFYRAKAVGKNGEQFKMFKFRSMRVNNDADIHKKFVTKLIKGEIGNDGNDDKPLKITDDPRITSVGDFLRKYSLDELPQVFNVLLGQMSLIGPRPCLPYEFDVYEDWYKKRAAIRPGITGIWQVAGRSEVAFEEMILLDLYYVYNRNIWMDINILIETVFVVLTKKGAY